MRAGVILLKDILMDIRLRKVEVGGMGMEDMGMGWEREGMVRAEEGEEEDMRMMGMEVTMLMSEYQIPFSFVFVQTANKDKDSGQSLELSR